MGYAAQDSARVVTREMRRGLSSPAYNCAISPFSCTLSPHWTLAPLPRAAMDRFSGSPRLMIVSDLDHTMVDHHDEENASLLRFNALWESEYRHDSLLVFSTGRSPTLYKQLRREKPLLTPDITIMSVGTEIAYGEAMAVDEGWEEYLNRGWDRNIVVQETARFPQLSLQPETEQRPHKVSFYVQEGDAEAVTRALLLSLENHGLDVKIIYSGGQDLDVLAKGAGKGQALAYLLNKLKASGRAPLNTLACGDSGNDAELFTVPDVHGVMVKNAQKELLQWYADNGRSNPKLVHASGRCAAGIIEAIGHFNLGPNLSPRDVAELCAEAQKKSSFSPGLEIVKLYVLYERWLRGEEDSSRLAHVLKDICYPSGSMVYPSGGERSFEEALYGLKGGEVAEDRGRRVWVDRLSLSEICADSWLAKFHKWESYSGGERRGCVVTALLRAKPESARGFELVHLHQTWLDGCAASGAAWVF
ncbi:sucrose-phosphatase 2-like isoform X2 [Wolffia australiana]